MINLRGECFEKYYLVLCTKYDRKHDFDVILGYVVRCGKMTCICRKHSNDVVQQVETPSKSAFSVSRHDFDVALGTTPLMTVNQVDVAISAFCLKYCDMLYNFYAFVWYIIKHLLHEYYVLLHSNKMKSLSLSSSNFKELLACKS